MVGKGSTYRAEYHAFCTAANSDVSPDEPRETGEIILDCVKRGLEQAVGTVDRITSTIQFGSWDGEDGYALHFGADMSGPAFTTPAQAALLGCRVEDRVSVALLELFRHITVLWAVVAPTPTAPTTQDATDDVA